MPQVNQHYENKGTLECELNVKVVINVQVGYFLLKNKRTSQNNHTGGNFENKCNHTHLQNKSSRGQFHGKKK